MNTIAILLSLLLFGSAPQDHDCKCKPAADNETTRWDKGHQTVRIVNEERVRFLQGTVRRPDDQPMSDVLVEVFPKSQKEPARLAACRTGEDGRFCFNDLPAGTYELRCSSVGFMTLLWDIVVDPKDKSNSDEVFGIHMEVLR